MFDHLSQSPAYYCNKIFLVPVWSFLSHQRFFGPAQERETLDTITERRKTFFPTSSRQQQSNKSKTSFVVNSVELKEAVYKWKITFTIRPICRFVRKLRNENIALTITKDYEPSDGNLPL